MDHDIARRLEEQAARIEEIYISVEKTRKYFLTTLIITVVMVALPLLGLLFIVPQFLETYSSTLQEFEGL